jgi:hypothetical protein
MSPKLGGPFCFQTPASGEISLRTFRIAKSDREALFGGYNGDVLMYCFVGHREIVRRPGA